MSKIHLALKRVELQQNASRGSGRHSGWVGKRVEGKDALKGVRQSAGGEEVVEPQTEAEARQQQKVVCKKDVRDAGSAKSKQSLRGEVAEVEARIGNSGGELVTQLAESCQTLREELEEPQVRPAGQEEEDQPKEDCDLLDGKEAPASLGAMVQPTGTRSSSGENPSGSPLRACSQQQGVEQLTASPEAQWRGVEERLSHRLAPLLTRMEELLAAMDQRTRQWTEHVEREKDRLQFAEDEARMQAERLREQLEHQLRNYESRAHDMLVEARGQLKGSLDYALEATAGSLEEHALQAQRKFEAMVQRSTRRLRDVLVSAQTHPQRTAAEALESVSAPSGALPLAQFGRAEEPASSITASFRRKPRNGKHQ